MDSACKRLHPDSRRRGLMIVVLSILAVALVLLVLGLTVFRPRHAITTVDSVRLAGLSAGVDVPNLAVDLNLTLAITLNAYNPNRVGFRYSEGNAELYYRGALVGEAEIPPGEVGAGGTVRTVVDLTVMAGRLAGDAAVYADVISGSVPFTTTTRVPGRVTVLGVFKIHMVSYTTCEVTVDVSKRAVKSSDCRYRTKL
ncbi:uncharacterized protein [Typha latifolia]|uniref:uncharacterized protein n=1 Tax=Typha latifolia TaxID=4733 RepID=UPI003C2F6CD2